MRPPTLAKGPRSIVTIGVLAGLCAAAPAYAGGWTTGGLGHIMLQLGTNYYFATDQFDGTSKQIPIQVFQYQEGVPFAAQVDSAYHSLDFNLYTEIGLLKHLDLLFYLPFWRTITQSYPDNPDFSVSGVGDGNIWLKGNVLNHPRFVLSLKGGIELPIGDAFASVAYPAPFQSKRLPMPLGDKEVAGDAGLLFSSSLFPVPLYFSAEVTGRFHSSKRYGDTLVTYSDEILYAFEAGYQLLFRKYVWCWLPEIDFIVNLRGIASIGNGRIVGPPPAGYSYNLYLPNDQSYVQLGPMINVHLFKHYFVAARYERVLWGKNTGVGNVVGVSIGYAR